MAEGNFLCESTEVGRGFFDSMWEDFKEPMSKVDLEVLARTNDLDFLGEGDDRVAFLDESGAFIKQAHACVVKIHKYGDITQNEAEVKNYQKVDDDTKRHLMTITDWDDGYKWVIMPYVGNEPTDRQIFELEKTFIENGWYVHDVNERNVRIAGGRPVLIDFGSEISRLDTTVMSKRERIDMKKWKWDID